MALCDAYIKDAVVDVIPLCYDANRNAILTNCVANDVPFLNEYKRLVHNIILPSLRDRLIASDPTRYSNRMLHVWYQ